MQLFHSVRAAIIVAGALPNIAPSSTGLPGANIIVQLLGWLLWIALAAAFVAIVWHAVQWASGSKYDNWTSVQNGKHGVLVSGVALIVIGAAQTIVQTLFAIGQGAH